MQSDTWGLNREAFGGSVEAATGIVVVVVVFAMAIVAAAIGVIGVVVVISVPAFSLLLMIASVITLLLVIVSGGSCIARVCRNDGSESQAERGQKKGERLP